MLAEAYEVESMNDQRLKPSIQAHAAHINTLVSNVSLESRSNVAITSVCGVFMTSSSRPMGLKQKCSRQEGCGHTILASG